METDSEPNSQKYFDDHRYILHTLLLRVKNYIKSAAICCKTKDSFTKQWFEEKYLLTLGSTLKFSPLNTVKIECNIRALLIND